jgi:hypothetical protein
MVNIRRAGSRSNLAASNTEAKAVETMAEKKFKTTINGKTIKFGAKGYSIAPGTKKGDAYCTRSAGIPKCKSKTTPCPNELSRQAWGCVGNKSVKSKAKKFKRL